MPGLVQYKWAVECTLSPELVLANVQQYSLVFMLGLIVGRIFDRGYTKIPLFLASALLVAATFLTAQCTVYWQFLLCQGFAIGVSHTAEPSQIIPLT